NSRASCSVIDGSQRTTERPDRTKRSSVIGLPFAKQSAAARLAFARADGRERGGEHLRDLDIVEAAQMAERASTLEARAAVEPEMHDRARVRHRRREARARRAVDRDDVRADR